MRWLFVALMVVHGSIHFMGPAKAFGWAEMAALTQPVSRPMGLVWGLAGLLWLVAAWLFVTAPRWWWAVALLAIAVSQVAIFSAWGDARFGTVANVVVLLVAIWAAAAQGPWGFRAQYRADVSGEQAGLQAAGRSSVLTESDLDELPGPVAGYLRALELLGRPVPRHLVLRWEGRIRSGPDDDWMGFTAEQQNFLDRPSRYFIMDARRGGLPVDVYHRYVSGQATMRVRLLSLVPMVDASGASMNRAETVTLFNDLVLFAPAALTTAPVRWEELDPRTVRGHYTVGDETVSATLTFGEDGLLSDFVSDDRSVASSDGRSFTPMRWSTPAPEWTTVDGWMVPAEGRGLWHAPDGSYAYFEGRVTGIELSP